MMAEIFKYIVIKLNVSGLKKQNMDIFIETLMDKLKNTNGFNNVIIIPTIETETVVKIVYQIKDNSGNYTVQDFEL